MSKRRIAFYLFMAILAVLVMGVPTRSQYIETEAAGSQTILAGRNVNVVSGTKLPFGDPWLQRQNEPSIATSTRNPMHLLAGANDYRTIDIPDDFKLPGIEGTAAADAWLGVYESFDGGQSWITTLLPGFPQDTSSEGQASPIKGYETACDPIVRAGANGLFYYCGIAFDRNRNSSAIFVARYQDDNNLEKVEVKIDEYGKRRYFGPIRYIDTKLIAAGSTSSSFIDMPNMAVDIPRKGALYGNIYVAYTVFSSTGADKIFFQKSTDGGVAWSAPVQLSTTGELVQRPVIAVDPTDLKGNTIYIAFRRFASGGVPDGIVVVRSTNGGKTFSKLPDVVSSFYPFDQGTSTSSFRTNSYPTMVVGDLGTVYVAWSQRQGGPSGQARIMISAFRKGRLVWSTPKVVDPTYEGFGHQFMPSLTFAAWKLMLAWYDQREDMALDGSPYIEDSWGGMRHTIDIRAAEGKPGVPPSFSPSVQLSRYLYVLDLDSNGNPIEENGYYRVIQAESSHINYPLFQLGTVPFHGDYIEITPSVRMLPPAIAFGFWVYNINPFEATMFHAAWTDNRDVRPPGGDTWGDWVNYSAPNSIQDSGWEPTYLCSDGSKTGMRNQNIYTANINKGVIMGSPGNTKQLDLPLSGEGGRTFVVFVKNTTEFEKTLRLLILQIGGVNASFDQFQNDDSMQVKVQPHSSVSVTVYVDRSTKTLAPVTVNAFEGLKLVGYVVLNPDPTNLPLGDPNNPFNNLGDETHDPDVSAPLVWNYDLGDESDPNASALLNPRVQNPRVQNYSVVNPRVQNEGVLNPRVQNESIVNNEVPNPRVQNAVVPNGALTDVTWTVTNEGNTTSAFTANIQSQSPDYFNGEDPPLIAQVLVYKINRVPVDKDCQLYETHQDDLMVNIANPRVQNPRVQNIALGSSALGIQGTSMSTQADDLTADDVTFYLAPGEQADVIFRVWDEDTTDGLPTFSPNMVIAEAVAEAVNTEEVEEGSTTPPSDTPPNSTPWTTPSPGISTSPLSMSFLGSLGGGNPAPQNLDIENSGGGTLSYTVEDDASWLSVYPDFGTSTGSPNSHSVSASISGLAVGTYTGTITIRDPLASNNPLRIPATLTISSVTIPSEWTNRYGDGYSFQAVAMAVDSAGNTFVTGTRIHHGEGDELDYCTIKINNLGELVWDATFDRGFVNDEPVGIVVDEEGNVVVTGRSESETGLGYAYDFVTIKYSGDDGEEMWEAPAIYNRLGEDGNADDFAKAIAVDSVGNIFVTGSSGDLLGHTDFATIKYSGSDGVPLWSTGTENGAVIYTGTGEDEPVAIAVDSTGNCFVTGSSQTSTNLDYATIKYAGATGNPLWSGAALYDGPMHSSDVPRAMAVDSAGDVVVTGSSEYGSGSGENYATIKYDGDNGNFSWTDLVDGAAVFMGPSWSSDVPTALAIDPSGNVYVTGSSYYLGGDVVQHVFATTKLNGNNGSSAWVARYAGPGGEDSPVAMAVDSSGNIYVTGNSYGIEDNYDYVTVRYDGDGNELWVRRYDFGGNDEVKAMALDSSGNIYVTGTSQGETETVYCTIKYDPNKPLLGLVGYYPFNGNADDASGNEHNGTEQGEGVALAQDRFGNQDSAYDFDGSDGYIDMGNISSLDFGTGDFTLETWIQMNSASSGPRHILGKRMDETAPYQHGWTRLYSLDGSIRFEFNDGWALSTPTTYNDGVWHHIAATRSSGAVSLYMDGQLIGSGTQTVDVSNSGSFKIGKWYFESSFNGKIDDVRIYNRALSATEVAEHYLR